MCSLAETETAYQETTKIIKQTDRVELDEEQEQHYIWKVSEMTQQSNSTMMLQMWEWNMDSQGYW